MAKKSETMADEPAFTVEQAPMPARESKPNPLFQSVADAAETGTAGIVRVDTTDRDVVKSVRNYLQRARAVLDIGLRIVESSEGVHFEPKEKKQAQYTANDIREHFGLEPDEKLSREIRDQYREDMGMAPVARPE